MTGSGPIGLFIPCYIDQLYPHVGQATVAVLEELGYAVEFPQEQTCCGQPMANTGCVQETAPLAETFLRIFGEYPYVVCPSGSCTAMVRLHYDEFLRDRPGFAELKGKTYELCEFLSDVVRPARWGRSFPYRVGLHQSCHGLRELRLGECSELVRKPALPNAPDGNKIRRMLRLMDDIEIVPLTRPDECCGFGGTFSVAEEDVSCLMGLDRLEDHRRAGAEVITAADMSCLMHMDGLLRRRGDPLRVMHVAEILAGYPKPK